MKTVVLAHRALIPVFKKLLNLELQLNYILLLIKYIMLKYSITEKSRLKMRRLLLYYCIVKLFNSFSVSAESSPDFFASAIDFSAQSLAFFLSPTLL